MIKPEQIPDEVSEELMQRVPGIWIKGHAKKALAAAISAWPNMRVMPAVELDQELCPAVVALPLPEKGEG